MLNSCWLSPATPPDTAARARFYLGRPVAADSFSTAAIDGVEYGLEEILFIMIGDHNYSSILSVVKSKLCTLRCHNAVRVLEEKGSLQLRLNKIARTARVRGDRLICGYAFRGRGNIKLCLVRRPREKLC